MRRRGDGDGESAGRLVRAWRRLRSSGFYEDDQAKPGPADEQQNKDRLLRSALIGHGISQGPGGLH